MKCIAIGGIPATGKTTLVRSLMHYIKPENKFKYGLLRGYVKQKNNISVLGIYEQNEVFAGTDKLSMAVQKDFDRYILRKDVNIVFEGDRLFTRNNLLNLTENYQTKIIVLQNDEKVIEERHKLRGDNQSDKFKRSRVTKIKNICEEPKLQRYIQFCKLSNLEHTEDLAKSIYEFIKS